MGYEDGLTIKRAKKNERRLTISEWLLGLNPGEGRKLPLVSIGEELVTDEEKENT